jgi:hypothetical protein
VSSQTPKKKKSGLNEKQFVVIAVPVVEEARLLSIRRMWPTASRVTVTAVTEHGGSSRHTNLRRNFFRQIPSVPSGLNLGIIALGLGRKTQEQGYERNHQKVVRHNLAFLHARFGFSVLRMRG